MEDAAYRLRRRPVFSCLVHKQKHVFEVQLCLQSKDRRVAGGGRESFEPDFDGGSEVHGYGCEAALLNLGTIMRSLRSCEMGVLWQVSIDLGQGIKVNKGMDVDSLVGRCVVR